MKINEYPLKKYKEHIITVSKQKDTERSHALKGLISEICATRINPEVKIEYNKLIEGEK